jgi:putative PEP-CTERM system TPR-repeat lipoprotein
MPQPCRLSWCLACAALSLLACSVAYAQDMSAPLKQARQYLAKGNLKAAEIEFRNAVRASPQDPVIRVRLAEVFLQLGDPLSAEREAKAARDRNGDEADYLPVLADALLRQSKFAEVQELIKPDSRNPVLESKVRLALGDAAAGLQDQAKAEELLSEAIRLDPSAVRPKIRLARLLSQAKPEQADKLIDEAIAADPHSTEALEAKGEILRARGDDDGAMRLFEEVLKTDPDAVGGRLGRANINIVRGNFGAANADLDPVLKATPDNFLANYLRALEFARQKKYAEADRILDRISPGFAKFSVGYLLQGETKLALGQSAQAELILAKYLGRVPDDQSAARLVATAALQQHAPTRAIGALKPFVGKSPAQAATLSLLGDAYLADGKPELALQQFKEAASLDPENPAIKTGLAKSELGIGRDPQGLADLEQAFSSKAGATVAGPTLVLSEIRAGRPDKAAEIAASLVARDANNPLYQALLGEARSAQRDYPAAEAAFRAALARDPRFDPAARGLAQLYLAMGRPDDATKVYTGLLAKKADDVAALLGLADIAIAQKKWPEAMEHVNRARTAAPNDPVPGLKLVALYEMQKDWANAKASAGELAAQFPNDADVLDTQGRAQFGAGDINGAISIYKRAYEIAPKSAPILSRYVALLSQVKRFPEARAVLQNAIAAQPGNASLKAQLIRVVAETDGVDQAVVQALAFGKDDPDNDSYDLVAAELCEKAGRANDAITLLDKAVAARPADDGLTIALSRLYTRTGDPTKAETVLTRRLKADPKNFAVASELARLYLTAGRRDDAKKLYNEVVLQKPDDVAALIGLAEIAVTEKKSREATDYIARARAAAPHDPAPGLLLVNMYGLRGDWKSATAAAAELVQKFPQNIDVLDAQARVQIATGDTTGALSTYKRAYEIAPLTLPILSRYVNLLKSAKSSTEARTILQAALDRDPNNPSLKAELIRVEADIGGLEAGLAKARSFARDDPGSNLYDVISAELYEKAGRAGEGVALLEKAAAATSSDDGLAIALAQIYTRTGDFAKAEALLTGRLKNSEKNPAAASVLAPLYMSIGHPDDAKKLYSAVLSKRPTNVAALTGLAEIAVAERRWPEATEYIARARAAAPNDPAPGFLLVNMYGFRQDWKGAVTAAAELAEELPNNVDVLDMQARTQLRAGDTDGAVSTYKRAYELALHSPQVLSGYLAALAAAKNFVEERTVLQTALDRDPQNSSLKAELIRVEAEIGGLDAGLTAARSFDAKDPYSSAYDIASAELYEKAGRVGEAVALLEKAVAAHPSDGGLTVALSGLYARSGNAAKAEAILKDRLKTDPKDYAVDRALAALYMRQDNTSGAIAQLTRLVSERPADAAALNDLAWLYKKQGDLATARQLAERAFELSPHTAYIHDTLGSILLAQGAADRALTYLGAANLSDPKNPEIQYRLAVALQRVGRPADARAMLEPLLASGVSFADRAEAEKLLHDVKRAAP